jgi:low temperature requirement protein LtrA
MVYWGWLNGSMYYDIHGTPGIRTDFTTLWQMLGVAAICVALYYKEDTTFYYLTLTLACMQAYITYLWWSVGIYDKEHRKLNVPFNICYLLALALLITCMYLHDGHLRTTLYWTILLVNYLPAFFINNIMKKQNRVLDLSPSMTERLGLLTIIVFGEVILGVINGMSDTGDHSRRMWLCFALGILIVFCLWMIFYSFIADKECRKGFLRGQYFQMLFIPALMTLGIAGASFRLLFPAAAGNIEAAQNSRLWFGGSIFVFLVCINRMTAFLVIEKKFIIVRKRYSAILLIPATLIAIITPIFNYVSLLQYLLGIFLILLVMLIAVTYNWYLAEKNAGEEISIEDKGIDL